MRMTVVAEPDNRRDKGDRDTDFRKGSHDASILCQWGITLSHASSFLTRQFYCAGGCAGLGETWTGFGGGGGGAETF